MQVRRLRVSDVAVEALGRVPNRVFAQEDAEHVRHVVEVTHQPEEREEEEETEKPQELGKPGEPVETTVRPRRDRDRDVGGVPEDEVCETLVRRLHRELQRVGEARVVRLLLRAPLVVHRHADPQGCVLTGLRRSAPGPVGRQEVVHPVTALLEDLRDQLLDHPLETEVVRAVEEKRLFVADVKPRCFEVNEVKEEPFDAGRRLLRERPVRRV